MIYMKFMTLAMCLVNSAKDGDLTLEEITTCMAGLFPDKVSSVAIEVKKAMADGKITVWEVFQILTKVIA